MKIGLLAIMLDESAYVDRWAKTIDRARELGRPFDRVLVVDGGSQDDTVDKLKARGIDVHVRPFSGNFADQRNFGNNQLDTEWVFELDADEALATPLLLGLRDIATNMARDEVDGAGVPRLNLIDGMLQEGPGTGGLDYQYRFHNKHNHWEGAVHEELVGCTNRIELLLHNGHFIVHDKSSARHAARNQYYRTLL